MNTDLSVEAKKVIGRVISRTPAKLLMELDTRLSGHGWNKASFPRKMILEREQAR